MFNTIQYAMCEIYSAIYMDFMSQCNENKMAETHEVIHVHNTNG